MDRLGEAEGNVGSPAEPVTRNCIYAVTGDLKYDEFVEYLGEVVREIEQQAILEWPAYVPGCLFTVNMPSTKIKNYEPKNGIGHAFVWITKREVCARLVGLSYDWTEIQEHPERESDLDAENETNCNTGADGSGVGGILIDVLKQDWSQPIRVTKRYEIPTNTKQDYTPSFQLAYAQRRADRVDGTLYCITTVPDRFSDARMGEIFAPFITKGESIKITRTDRRNVYIEFSNPDDAHFALHMVKRYRVDADLELAFDMSMFLPPTTRKSQHQRSRGGGGAQNKTRGTRGNKNTRW